MSDRDRDLAAAAAAHDAATGPAWRALEAMAAELAARPLRTLFAEDPARFERLSARQGGDLLLDFSKERLTPEILAQLVDLAEAAGLPAARARMFAGEIVNGTEERAARHDALRAEAPEPAAIAERREAFLDFAQRVRDRARTGAGGAAIRHVLNIGIGGSYLGPRLMVEALAPYADGPEVRFVANVDPWSLARALDGLDPAATLVIVASKSFGTQETMINARAARAWAEAALGAEAAARNFCAVTANPARALAAGFAEDAVFEIWDWAGGRYSVWSAIGLCGAIAVGRANFEAFLEGAREMDAHFRDAPLGENLPALMALIGIWRRNLLGRPSYVISAYEDRLETFSEYVQQLEMESNGKSVRRSGAPAGRATAPVIIGGAGTNTQHSFFQMLHQGADGAPVDFLVGAETPTEAKEAHAVLLAHCLAQSQAMMAGLTETEAAATLGAPERAARLAAHVACPGDRPSTTLMYRRLDPRTLGRIIALYEHKVFAQSVIWDIECFDQWGVELGKRLANGLIEKIADGAGWDGEDASTRGLLEHRRRLLAEG